MPPGAQQWDSVYLAGEEAEVQTERDPECGTKELESSLGVREPSDDVVGWND